MLNLKIINYFCSQLNRDVEKLVPSQKVMSLPVPQITDSARYSNGKHRFCYKMRKFSNEIRIYFTERTLNPT